MSACISSHGEYDAHETDPDTYVCKWCHEFDETGAIAEIARLRGRPVTGMEHAIERAARVVDDILCADPQIAHEMRGDEPDKIARALADAGMLAPAPLREVTTPEELDALPVSTVVVDFAGVPRTKRYPDSYMGGGWTHAGREPLSTHALADGRPLTVVYAPVNRAEGDGRAES